ncbi:MAG: hypothetical protein KC609_20995 [Myxococcales bacterium]|nr:hypothetical protein [Myxococcales bacterium]
MYEIKAFTSRRAIAYGALFGVIMAATTAAAVTAIWPQTAYWMKWAICRNGTVLEHESRRFSYKPGQRGVERIFRCVPEASRGQHAAGRIVTFEAFAWMIVFWLLPMVALTIAIFSFLFARIRRRYDRAMQANTDFRSALTSGADPRAALAQLRGALGVANAATPLPSPRPGAPSQDPVDAKLARLEKIEELHRKGVIDQQQYEKLKKEILGA